MAKPNALTRGKKRKVMELLDAGDLEQARTLLEQICRADRRDLESWLYLGGVSNALGRPEDAERAYRQARQIDSGSFQALYGLAVAAENRGDRDAAIDLYRRAIAIEPRLAPAYNNLGSVLHELERYDEAADCYRQALKLEPENPEIVHNLGVTLQAQEKLEDAEACYERAIGLRPDLASAHNNLAVILSRTGRPLAALEHARRALAADPNCAEAYDTQGGILQMRSQSEQARESYERAFQLDETNVSTLSSLASLCLQTGDIESAGDYLRRAREIAPGAPAVVASHVKWLDLEGKVGEARDQLQPLLEQQPVSLQIATAYARLCHHSNECEKALAVLETSLAGTRRAPTELMAAHFAAANILDRIGEYDRAFSHYAQANDLKPVEFDRDEHHRFIDRLITVLAPEHWTTLARATNESALPVFIVGMPRSGTTLVEQILAAHPEVSGGGELNDIVEIAATLPKKVNGSTGYPESLRGMSADVLDRYAQTYLHKLGQIGGDALRVTDKLPQNFLHLGLIALLFPGARILHCRRDPMDTCLSCYFHDFAGAHPYAYDLEDLGYYYREYDRLMEHWHKVLGPRLMDVQYEELVADLEGVSRQMIDFCGLEWSDECLRFYESKRLVRTASYDQVRRPIYSKSIGRWRHYESHLEPLKRALSLDTNSA